MRRILVTGTTGYVGAALADHLAEAGQDVVRLGGRADFERLDAFFHDDPYDVILHAAFSVDFAPPSMGRGEESPSMANTRRLLDRAGAQGAPPVVFTSAAGVMGVSGTDRALNETHRGRCDPAFVDYQRSAYIQDKLAAENLLDAYPGPVTILYLCTVYGAGMQATVTGPLKRMAGPNPLVVVPPGSSSFLDLRDLLSAVDRVVETGIEGRYILSSGNADYRTLFSTAARVQGVAWRTWVARLPGWMVRLIGSGPVGRLLDPHARAVIRSAFGYKHYSPERARRCLGWAARHSLEDALRAALLTDP